MVFEILGLSGIYDLMFEVFLLGGMAGYFMHWFNTIEGKYWYATVIQKKPAKILTQFHSGHLYSEEVIVPKSNAYKKPLGFLDKLFKKEQSPHTVVGNWFDADAPVWRKIGSRMQRVFNFIGQAPLFDPATVEYGYYDPTPESNEFARKSKELNEKAVKLREAGSAEEATAAEEEAMDNYHKALQAIRWNRVTVMPSIQVTSDIEDEENLVKARIIKGYHGKFEALMKNITFFLMVAAAGGALSAILQIYSLFFKNGIKLF